MGSKFLSGLIFLMETKDTWRLANVPCLGRSLLTLVLSGFRMPGVSPAASTSVDCECDSLGKRREPLKTDKVLSKVGLQQVPKASVLMGWEFF